MSVRALGAAACAGIVLSFALPAHACGHCDEDRIAAVYDHALTTAAKARGHRIAYLSVESGGTSAGRARPMIVRAVASIGAVDAASLRTSTDGSAMALAYEPRQLSPERLVEVLNGALAGSGLRVSLLGAASR